MSRNVINMEQFRKLTAEERRKLDSENSKWFEQFKKAKATDKIIELINDTKSPYCLCCIAEFLEEQAKLIDSKDPTEHFDGFIAQTNIKVCLYKLRRMEQEQQWSLQEN